MPQLSYFKVLGTWEPSSPKGIINGNVTFTMLIQNNGVLAAPTLDNPAVVVPTVVHSVIDNNTLQSVSLLANTAALNLTGTLYYTATFSDVSYREPGKPEAGLTIGPITFAASTDTTAVNLVNVTPAAGVVAAQLTSILSSGISDATALGRQLLTVPDAATVLSDLELGGLTIPITQAQLASAVQTNLNLAASALQSIAPGTDISVSGNTVSLSSAAQTTLGLASTALQPSAVVNNTDGTLSVTGVNALEPLSTVTILTASTAPAIGQTTYYNATSGNLTPTLPALSGLRAGARLAVRRDPADVSQNTVTLSCAGSDTFYSSGATSTTFPLIGEQREFQVVSVSGVKYWSPAGSLNPVAALDTRYLAGASKLVSIGDTGYGIQTAANATSTAGTSEMMFTVGVAATGITAMWNHWYSTTVGNIYKDTDPAGPISFNASLRVVSSTNPGTVTGTIYRLTFNGRTTATLDPGGRIIADTRGVSVVPGDVVAIRTYLSSGTAYSPRVTYGGTGWGGFTATTDLTAPGSAAIAASGGVYYGPSVLLGRAQGSTNAKSVLLVGDSIGASNVDQSSAYITPSLSLGGFLIRALSGAAGLVNASVSGDTANSFQTTDGSSYRLSFASLCNDAIIQYGTNDFVNSFTAAAVEAEHLNFATWIRRQGISKVFVLTVCPRTTSTDGWATTTNQTPLGGETQRVLYNTWVRAGCPINATTLAPVAVGTSGALLAGQYGHPITGFFDAAAKLESSLNSGLWLPCNRVATGSMTSGSSILTSSTANFLSAKQEVGGDLGTMVTVVGAGASGVNLASPVFTVTSGTQVQLFANAGTTVTNAQINIGNITGDGVHPSPHGHYLMAQAINPAML